MTLEGWVSVDDGRGGLDLLELVDCIPFAEGEVKPGAAVVASEPIPIGP